MPGEPLGASCFPLSVPQGPVSAGRTGVTQVRPHLGTSGGDLCPAPSKPKRGWRRDGGSRCSVTRRGQRPTAHRTHPVAVGANPQRLAETLAPWAVLADASRAGGLGGNHYEPAAAEPKLQGCSAGHAMGSRYCTRLIAKTPPGRRRTNERSRTPENSSREAPTWIPR